LVAVTCIAAASASVRHRASTTKVGSRDSMYGRIIIDRERFTLYTFCTSSDGEKCTHGGHIDPRWRPLIAHGW
jgi:predicted lipoprotein with Yx(FWY)xxD motif